MTDHFANLILIFAQGAFPEPIDLRRDYLGVFDSGARVLLFVYKPESAEGSLYLSTGWNAGYPVERGRLPQNLPLTATESRWILSCWSALHIKATGSMPPGAMGMESLCAYCVAGYS